MKDDFESVYDMIEHAIEQTYIRHKGTEAEGTKLTALNHYRLKPVDSYCD